MYIPRLLITRLLIGFIGVGFLSVCILSTFLASAQAQSNLASSQAQADQIQAEIDAINLAAEQAVERYNQAGVELELTNQRLADSEKALAEASANLAAAQDRLNTRMEKIYRAGSVAFVDVIVNTSDFNEFMSRFDMLGRIGSQDKADVAEVLRYKTEVEDTRTELEQSRKKQEELVGTLEKEKAEIESRLAARQEVLNGVDSEIAGMLAQQQAQAQQQVAAVAPASSPEASPSPEQTGSPGWEPNPPYEPPPPPGSGGAVSIAMQYLGTPYVWGGASPSGFDCSGLTMYVYAQMGVYLPHSAAAQRYSGIPVSYNQLAPGDLVFFGSPISHVGIYIGGGSMIHAPYEGAVVSITSVGAVGGYSGACRI
ncbi:putative endopeptidase p60 precursor [bacterium BMS3Abin01]|nr:putative endopeptidase p60 precursor [bacterium BMS3Abin01]HDY69812.1 hypothetical protein [Actinomycetota bacterium]